MTVGKDLKDVVWSPRARGIAEATAVGGRRGTEWVMERSGWVAGGPWRAALVVEVGWVYCSTSVQHNLYLRPII